MKKYTLHKTHVTLYGDLVPCKITHIFNNDWDNIAYINYCEGVYYLSLTREGNHTITKIPTHSLSMVFSLIRTHYAKENK